MLRYRLVCGINDEQIQRRLLAESTLDFKKAMMLSIASDCYINGDCNKECKGFNKSNFQ